MAFLDDIIAQLRVGTPEGDPGGRAAAGDEGAPRIAVYDTLTAPPRVITVPESRLPDLIDALATRTYDLAHQQGSRVPYSVLREIIENLIHAYFSDVVITILDNGNTIRIADHGPGIADKDKALRPGFTTATGELKRFIRGVGSGLPIAKESLELMEGMLSIEDNLGQGTVVTLKLPPKPPAVAAGPATGEKLSLSERQLKILFLLLELGPCGPSRVANELSFSPSTAYRELVALESYGLVQADSSGRRSLTKEGTRFLDGVL